MVNILKQSGRETTYITEFMIDKEDEISTLPIFPNVAKGSTCFVIEDSSVYMLASDNTWKPI